MTFSLNDLCPHCGASDPWQLAQNHKLRCRKCRGYYSATSGTALHGHKLPPDLYKEMIRLAEEGLNDSKIARKLGLNYRTVWSRLKQFGFSKRSRAGRKPKSPTPPILILTQPPQVPVLTTPQPLPQVFRMVETLTPPSFLPHHQSFGRFDVDVDIERSKPLPRTKKKDLPPRRKVDPFVEIKPITDDEVIAASIAAIEKAASLG